MAFPFSKIALLFAELEKVESHDPPLLPKARRAESRARIESWFGSNRAAISRLNVRNSSALLRALLPERSIDRVYGLQSRNLCRTLCRAFNLSTNATRDLEAYSVPGRGDLGSCLERVVNAGGPPANPQVTLEDVDLMLEKLAGMSAFSGPAVPKSSGIATDRATIIRGVLLRATAPESKWIVRLILKDLSSVQLDDHVVLRSFHFLLPDLLRFQNDFEKAVTLLKDELAGFPFQSDIRSESLHLQQVATLIKPCVGVKVGRPDFRKARSPKQCLEMVRGQKWVLERKYDGEYCEIHIGVDQYTDPSKWITIFSKGGRNSTMDRKALLPTLVECLRLGQRDCKIKRKAILLGEIIVCKGRDNLPLPFEQIRKHVSRSGRFLGTSADSQADRNEQLAIVFFDLLLLDEEILLRRSVEIRRCWLRAVYQKLPGRVFGAEWRIVDFAAPGAEDQLLMQFAASITRRCEGLILKPCGVPYMILGSHVIPRVDGYIKLKKDYMEGLGDDADLAILGASYNAQRATKHGLPGLQWSDFHLGCLLNKDEVQRYRTTRPRFKIVDTISHSTCIPMPILRILNSAGQYSTSRFIDGEQPGAYDVEFSADCHMDATFNTPIVVEVLGSEFVKPPNCNFFMLRHARMKKLHEDRSWKSTISFQELQDQARRSRAPPEDAESQDIRERVEDLQRRCERKFEHQQTGTPSPKRSASKSDSSSADHLRNPERLRIVRPMQARILPSDHKYYLPISRSDKDLGQVENSVVTNKRPLGLDDTYRVASHKRSRPVSNIDEKKPQVKACWPILPKGYSPLTDITNTASNELKRSKKEPEPILNSSALTDPPDIRAHSSPDSDSNFSNCTPPSSPPCAYAEFVTCQASSCLFSNVVIYLTPCIRSTPYIVRTLLGKHNSLVVPSISHWDRASFLHKHLAATVSESQAYAAMRKVVLAERHRERALRRIKQELVALNGGAFRERVEIWDWRVLEEKSCKEHILVRANAMTHFLGATVFDESRQKSQLVAVW
nr:dna ligase 4 [Quercus suber]